MAKQVVDVGTVPNDGTGDTIRDGCIKINANFDELYGIAAAPEAYGAGWDGAAEAPTKNDVYDKIETLSGSIPGAYTDEMARDAIGSAVTDNGLLVATVDDAGNTIDFNVPAAIASDLNTGTSTSKAVTPDALAGSNLGVRCVQIALSDMSTAITTGDGKGYFRVTAELNGMNLVSAGAVLDTAGTGGGFLLQLRRKRSGSDVDMLSTRISIDSGENDSGDAGTPPAINSSNDDVATGDRIYFDQDGVPTGGKGLNVFLGFQLP